MNNTTLEKIISETQSSPYIKWNDPTLADSIRYNDVYNVYLFNKDGGHGYFSLLHNLTSNIDGIIVELGNREGLGIVSIYDALQTNSKFYTLDISKRMKKLLEQKGAKVILLRTKDTNKSLYQRVKKVNQSNGDFLVSVHINSFINGAANGSETYYYKKSERTPAIYIQKHMTRELKLKNNGIKHAKMYILKYSKIPGVLIEPCFLTNKKEYTLLKTIPFRNKIAKATVNGLEEYYKNK